MPDAMIQLTTNERDTIAYLLREAADTWQQLAKESKSAATRVRYDGDATEARKFAQLLVGASDA